MDLWPGTNTGDETAPSRCSSAVLRLLLLGLPPLFVVGSGGCTETRVTGEGEFGRAIPLASASASPLPRLAWLDACPGSPGGCTSYCDGPPSSCPADACMPLLIDSGTPVSVLADPGEGVRIGRECVEVRGAEGILKDTLPETLAKTTAAFRFMDAPILRVARSGAGGWAWQVGDDREAVSVGGIIGGNVLRDFAVEFRHPIGGTPSVAFFSSFPGSEAVLADQGLAYVRLQYPGYLLGRLLNDVCEFGADESCELSNFDLTGSNQEQLFESTRALVDACVAPPPCAVHWDEEGSGCVLSPGSTELGACEADIGSSATLLVATGVPGLVLFSDSAQSLIGAPESLPSCDDEAVDVSARACTTGELGSLYLPGWPPLDDLTRVRVRSLGLVQGLDQASGRAPCQRLRRRLEGLEHQCEGFLAEGQPVRPGANADESMDDAAVVLGEVSWGDDQLGGNSSRWVDALIVPATAAPVISLRREITPEGAQPDGLVGGALLSGTETVLDLTEATTSPGVRVRCLDPGRGCLAVPACSSDVSDVSFEEAKAGRTSCCFGLPADLIAQVVLNGEGKDPPRAEDACCLALPQAFLSDLQSEELGLCPG